MAPELERGLSVPELFEDVRYCINKASSIAASPKDPAALAYAMSMIDSACSELREAKEKIRSLKTAMNRECSRQVKRRGPVNMAEVFDICQVRIDRANRPKTPSEDPF